VRITLEPAYVLHARPWRDSSLIVELFTITQGRIAAAARGARRPKSRLQGLLQPFRPLLVCAAGRGEVATLSGAELRLPGGRLLALQGRTLISGFYLNELLMKLLARHDPHPRLFEAYEAALAALGDAKPGAATADDPEPAAVREQGALRRFERLLLSEIGYGLVLDHDVASGAPIDAAAEYEYHPERGPVAVETFTGIRETEALRPRAGVRLRGSTLLALACGDLSDPESLREARRLMRMALGICLNGQPLRSRELFRAPSGGMRAGEQTSEPGDATVKQQELT
jgi:DNA repair protein RecO (recombination protein O)